MEEMIEMLPRYRVPTVKKNVRGRKKKTHDEYVAELAIKNPNVEVIENYINSHEKITHRCLIHDICWKVSPVSVLKGGGCKKCHQEKLHNSRSKTHEQYIEDLKIKNPNVIPLEKYINNRTKIKHKCIIHNIEWESMPDNVLQGGGCHECLKQKISDKNKKPHEDYIKELKIKNPYVEVLEEYINSSTPILHRYLKCGHQEKVSPASILQGCNCRVCSYEISATKRRKTNEEYIRELEVKNPNLEPLEKYVGANIKILHRYKTCRHKSKITPASALRGYGCDKCARKNVGDRCRKTHEEYVNEVNIKRPDVEVVEKYINNSTKILHRFKKCNHEIMVSPANILNGQGCSNCKNKIISEKRLKTHDKYVTELLEKGIQMRPLEKYINDRTKIKHLCLIHNTEHHVTPNNVLHNKGCIECGKEKFSNARRKQHSDYIVELSNLNPFLKAVEEYNGSNTHILHSCCYGHQFKMTPSVALRGGLCPVCNCSQSKGENTIEEFLKLHNILYVKQHKYDNLIGINGGLLSYDFYLPQYNLLIEFQGEQHKHPIEHFGGIKKFIKQKIHDTRKRKYCHDNNINLLEIWYYEINKTEQILEQYLNNLKLESVTTTGVA